MKKISVILLFTGCLIGCVSKSHELSEGVQSQVIKKMIEAVNQKDADKYVKDFSEDVQVYVASELKLDGRDALQKNRARHFKNYPEVRSEIQYLLEIDNKVIMHDKVWLDNSGGEGRDIVEIFTFDNGRVLRVDVIQPKDLFQ